MASMPPRAGIGTGPAAARKPDADRQRRGYERLSAVSGLVFAALFALAIVLVSQAPRLQDPVSAYQAFYAGNTDVLAAVGLNVVPFAGIAFLWHLAMKRAMHRAFAPGRFEIQGWLQLAAGLVFICMMFVGTAAVGAVALLSALGAPELPPPEVARALSSVGYGVMFVFGVRMAGMYMLTSITLARKVGVLPGWLAVLGYLAAAFLLVTTTYHPVALLVYPTWVVVMGVVELLHASRTAHASEGE